MVDHDRLIQVWKLELERRSLANAMQNLEDKISDRSKKIHLCKQRRFDAGTRIREIESLIPQWEKQLEVLHKRIALVEQSVQRGQLQDADSANQQIERFQVEISNIETQYLEGLEEQDKLDLQRALEMENIALHQAKIVALSQELSLLRAPSMDRVEVIEVETNRLLSMMNPSVANRYRLANSKKERAVEAVLGDSCGGCRLTLPTELCWTALHRSTICHCPNCGVFLIPSPVD